MLVALLSLSLLPSSALAQEGNAYGQYDVGDATTFATMPAGNEWPEGVAVDYDRDLVYVTGPAAAPTFGSSWVLVYDLDTGDLLETVYVAGPLFGVDALVECALDADGHLYVNSTTFGVLKFTRNGAAPNYTWTQSSYTSSAFPILVTLPPIPNLPPSIPNGMAFGPDGELYVTDSMQGIVFMVPSGGGTMIPLIIEPVTLGFFSGGRMGANGIKLDPDREFIYIAYTGGDGDGPGPLPAVHGKIYRVPYSNPSAPLELVYTYGDEDLPDGLAFDHKGNLFVVLAGANAVSVLSDLDGTTYESNYIDGPNGGTPFTQPSTISLDRHGKFALVVNHALDSVPVFSPIPDPSPFVVNRVYVDVRGDSLP